MNRNQYTRFSRNPANVDIERSSFDRSSQYKTTLSAGKLIPFYIDEVTAGDTFSLDTSFVCRMATPIAPVMDTAFLDKWYFFVPHRILWENWKAMNGEDDPSAWNTPTEYIAPMIKPLDPDAGFPAFSNADYLGLPTNVPNIEVNAMPFRALAMIWNEFFRDQNLQEPLLINKGGASSVDRVYANSLFDVNKRHDFYTSALPSPQKGPSVLLPLTGFAPVVPMADDWSADQLRLADYNFPRFTSMVSGSYTTVDGTTGNGGTVLAGSAGSSNMGLDTAGATNGTDGLTFTNLGADGTGYEVTINAMRLAFAIQRIFERDARGGSRYREFIKNHFNVTMPDSTAQIPEYLGGESDVINMSQVVQQSATDSVTPQGNTAGLSKTVGRNHSFAKSFVEPGYVIGVMAVRTLHSYQQGIDKLWSRKSRFDWYLPALAHIGEQPILVKEIYATGNVDVDESVFGYQEAWADYRYKQSRVTAAFRSNYTGGSLDFWHYADDYESRPFLSADWIKETSVNVERTLAVSEELSPNTQFIVDIWIDLKCARPMPLYSIPGLLDHF